MTPEGVYANAGWISWFDWLGYRDDWRPFDDARTFAQALGLKFEREWQSVLPLGKKTK